MPVLQPTEVEFNDKGFAKINDATVDDYELRERNGKFYINMRFALTLPNGEFRHQYTEQYLTVGALPYTAQMYQRAFGTVFPMDVVNDDVAWSDTEVRNQILAVIRDTNIVGKTVNLTLKKDEYEKDGETKTRLKVNGVYPAKKSGGGNWAALMGDAQPVAATVPADDELSQEIPF